MSVFKHLERGRKLLQNSTEDSIQRILVKLKLCSRQGFGQLLGKISQMQGFSNIVTDVVKQFIVNRLSVKPLGYPALLDTFPVWRIFHLLSWPPEERSQKWACPASLEQSGGLISFQPDSLVAGFFRKPGILGCMCPEESILAREGSEAFSTQRQLWQSFWQKHGVQCCC